MAVDYGIKISKPGYAVTDTPTTTTKKNFTILSTDDVHKISTQGVITSSTNIAHGLGFTPYYDTFVLTDSDTLARHSSDLWGSAYGWSVTADATYLYCTKASGPNKLFYVIYLDAP